MLVRHVAPVHGQTTVDVEALLTADNAYSFGWGSVTTVSSYFGPIYNDTIVKWSGCPPANAPGNLAGGVERWSIQGAPLDGYFYLVSDSDDGVYQGVLGSFRDLKGPSSGLVLTGDPAWEVCAANNDKWHRGASQAFPSLADVHAAIEDCNKNLGPLAGVSNGQQTSGGWVDATKGYAANQAATLGVLYPGASDRPLMYNGGPSTVLPPAVLHGTENPYGAVSCIDGAAAWMWFNANPAAVSNPVKMDDPKIAGLNYHHREFLVFRLPIRVIKNSECADLSRITCATGPSGPSGCYDVTLKVTNNTGQPITHVLLAPSTGSSTPSVYPVAIAANDTTPKLITVRYCPPPNTSGAVMKVTLAGPAGRCNLCSVDIRLDLPRCDPPPCAWVAKYTATCVPGAPPGTFDLSFGLKSQLDCPARLYLAPKGGAKVSPDAFKGPFPLNPGNPNYVGKIRVTGANASVFCMDAILQCVEGSNCCTKTLCFDVPQCWPSPLPSPTPDITPLDDGTR